MREAIALGETRRATAPPNPWVGCVIASGGRAIGRGAHVCPGTPHAEPLALREAGAAARGATAYVSLEPCAHQGRTPPCADALIAAGVARVVVAIEDPDMNVRGQGIARLRAAGIQVDVGVGAVEAAASLAPYLTHRTHGRPYCVVKVAMSLDGKVAARDGSSQWITGPAARQDVHRRRALSQAVIIGANTALSDRPSLTARIEGVERQPLRVLCDSTGRVSRDEDLAGPLFDPSLAETLVLTTEHGSPAAIAAWQGRGAAVEVLPTGADGRIDLLSALDCLGKRGALQAFVEGGAALHTALLRAGLVDKLVVYVAPLFLGTRGLPFFGDEGPASLGEAFRWKLCQSTSFGDEVCLEYERGED